MLPLVLGGTALLLAGCRNAGPAGAADSDTLDIPAFDTATVLEHIEDTLRVRAVPSAPVRRLGPLADSLSQAMTFLARFQSVFVAAGRRNRLLVDIGRIDAKLGTPARTRAYQEAVKALSPVHVGDRLRLHGPWGAADATVKGFDEWNGRMVATLDLPPTLDSLVRRKRPVPLVALAVRSDSARPPVVDSCARDSVGALLAARVTIVGDSLTQVVQADTLHIPPWALKSRRVQVTHVVGCFGPARVLLFADLSANGYEFVRERAVLVDTAGRSSALRVSDLRFKAHEALRAFDADSDGVDDVAAIGRAQRTGGTVVLHLDLAKRRLEYVMSGFAWESF